MLNTFCCDQCGLGGLTLSVGWMLGAKFRSVRRELAAEDQARKTFHDFDEDEDGRLSTSELARLCHQMGSKLTHNELQAAVTTLDVNRDGYVQVRGAVGWTVDGLPCSTCMGGWFARRETND